MPVGLRSFLLWNCALLHLFLIYWLQVSSGFRSNRCCPYWVYSSFHGASFFSSLKVTCVEFCLLKINMPLYKSETRYERVQKLALMRDHILRSLFLAIIALSSVSSLMWIFVSSVFSKSLGRQNAACVRKANLKHTRSYRVKAGDYVFQAKEGW